MFQNAIRIDMALTSCIAISFGFNGLIDLKWMKERSYYSWYVSACLTLQNRTPTVIHYQFCCHEHAPL